MQACRCTGPGRLPCGSNAVGGRAGRRVAAWACTPGLTALGVAAVPWMAGRHSFNHVVPLDAAKDLQAAHGHKLQGFLERDFSDHSIDAPAHRHGHDKSPSIITAGVAAIINYLLMFGLCCAYGMIIFEDDHNAQHRALGVKMTLSSAFTMGLLLAGLSRIPVAVGGTDLNPVVFLGGFVNTMSKEIANSAGLTYPSTADRRLDASGGLFERLLGASNGPTEEFCTGLHLQINEPACADYHSQLRATTIFAVTVSSAVLGVMYFCLGRFRLTRYLNYMPASITEAFLSCIGYKVFKYALKFCNYDPKIFVPAACIGVPMYFLKAMHVGNPAVLMPTALLTPLVIFYAILYGTGSDISKAREDNLMFPTMNNIPFYAIWTDSLLEVDKINIGAWMKTLPDLAIMVIVCVLDCALKISATENKMPIQVNSDYEIMLHGAGNFLVVACGSSVGYMQLKFNVISYGIMGNTKDRRAGALYAVMCGACFFGTIAHFNYLPRFFLGTLLFFAGAGFVAENLWGSRKYLSFLEWIEILLILAAFIVTGQLLPAVAIGGLLCGISFIMKYARVPSIAGHPLTGKDVTTRECFSSTLVQKNLLHIAASWLLVIRLKGCVFFGSAHAVTNFVRKHMELEEQQGVPSYRRLKFVIFDCELLDGMDASAAKAMLKLSKDCAGKDVKILWSSMTPQFIQELKTRNILSSGRDWFIDLNSAVHYVELRVWKYRIQQQEVWTRLHEVFALDAKLTTSRLAFEPFRHIFLMDGARIGCPWRYCTRTRIRKYRTVLSEPGKQFGKLYLIHSGSVALFDAIPSGAEGDEDWSPPVAIYRHGWFLNREALLRAPSQHYAIAIEDGEVLCWTQDQWWLMSCERPLMMLELLKAAMKQQKGDNERASKSADSLPTDMDDQEWLDFEDDCLYASETQELVSTWSAVSSRKTKSFNRTKTRSGSSETSWAWPRKLRKATESSLNSSPAQRVDTRKPSRGRKEPEATKRDPLGRFAVNLPEELQLRLTGLRAALALERMNFFDNAKADKELFLPELPAVFRDDLEMAFRTFSVCSAGVDFIQPEQAVKALMYMGVFRRVIERPPEALTKAGFLLFGRRALMARLTEYHRSMIHEGFKKYAFPSGFIRPGDLAVIFKKFVRVDFHLDDVEYISRSWLPDPNGQFDVEAFTSLVSWFLRKHEHDWDLVRGFRDVMDLPPDGSFMEMKLTAEMLQCKAGISLLEAEEVLWSADWVLSGQGNGRSLDFGGFMAAVLICLDAKHDKLPPPPNLGALTEEACESSALFAELSDRQSTCCGQEVQAFSIDSEVLNRYNTQLCVNEGTGQEPEAEASTFRARMHLLLEDPNSSREAAVLSAVISVMIVLSVIYMVTEAMLHGTDLQVTKRGQHNILFGVELFFTVVFTTEFVLRLAVANALKGNTLLGFLMTPRNICDFIAILPFYLEVTVEEEFEALGLLRIVRLARLGRLARIARLSRKIPMAAPVSVVLVVIGGIYLLKQA